MKVKKWIAAALSFAMLLSTMGLTAFAVGEGEGSDTPVVVEVGTFEDFKAALTGEDANVNIKITEDFESTESIIVSGKTVTLDLNGHMINAKKYLELTNHTAMTVTDSSENESGELAFSTGASNSNKDMFEYDYTERGWIHAVDSTFCLEKGTLSSCEAIWGYKNAILFIERSTVTINGGTFALKETGMYGTAITAHYSEISFNGGFINGRDTQMVSGNDRLDTALSVAFYLENNSKLSISGGQVIACVGVTAYNAYSDTGNLVEITGGEITSLQPCGIAQLDVLNMSGGTITQSHDSWLANGEPIIVGSRDTEPAISVSGGIANISGNAVVNGYVVADASYSGDRDYDLHYSSTLNISGGTINGDILSDKSISTRNSEDINKCGNTITITGGTITGELQATARASLIEGEFEENDAFEVSGGTFEKPVDKKWFAEGFAPVVSEDGSYVFAEVANEIQVRFAPTTDETVFDIVLACADEKIINRLNSADLTFKSVNPLPSYEIIAGEHITLTPKDGDRYLFNFDGVIPDQSGAEITIGQVKFSGYGSVVFFVDGDAETNIVNAAKIADNIVDSFVPGGGTDKGIFDLNNEEGESGRIDAEINAPTQRLEIAVKFPNAVENKEANYQKMTVTVSGGDLVAAKEFALGSDSGENVTFADGAYTVVIADELTKDTAYTVTVSGEGYRTARYTVNMTDDKSLTFWNNVMDEEQFIEEGKAAGAVTKNFLAGDIVKDNNINIYDLSAVVSYFGEDGLTAANKPEYAKYDLNRDGKIDSKDVAMVLVSWGE